MGLDDKRTMDHSEEVIRVDHITKDYGHGRGVFDFDFSFGFDES